MNTFDYSGMSYYEMVNLCSDKNSLSGYTEWKYWSSEIYSFGKYLRLYGRYPKWLPLYVSMEHGITVVNPDYIPPHETNDNSYCFFMLSPKRIPFYKGKTEKPCFPLKSPFVYCRERNKFKQDLNAKGTLFFFSHSTSSIENRMDIEKLCAQLKGLPSQLQPVCICLHMHDINKNMQREFLKEKFPVYTAGNTSDIRFSERFYELIKHFKYTASNAIGSNTFYSVEMGIPFFFYGDPPDYYNLSDQNIPIGDYEIEKDKFYQEAVKLFTFKDFDIRITDEQKDFVSTLLGLKTGLSRSEVSKILWKAYFSNETFFLIPLRFLFSWVRICFRLLRSFVRNLYRFFLGNQDVSILIKKMEKYYYGNVEYKRAIEILRTEGFTSFPFDWVKEYDMKKIKVFYEDDYPFVFHGNKKLFFPNSFKEDEVKTMYNSLLIEQDYRSTHSYFSDTFVLPENSLFLDVGCAEGMISLENIEKINKLILFECDQKWVNALRKTFFPYKEKVNIICKYVSNKNNKSNITVDAVLTNTEKTNSVFIKADIEGFERKMLLGCKKTFNRFSDCRLTVCTYHHIDDKVKITKMLKKGFDLEYSKSYMVWPWLAKRYKLRPPYFTSGIIRARKK